MEDSRSADPEVENDQFRIEPGYQTDEPEEIPDAWTVADIVRFLLRQRTHNQDERKILATAVTRQIPTVVLYKAVSQTITRAQHRSSFVPLSAYVILFPGEGRDNTGIKDLNDNVLGYTLNNEFVTRRQLAIGEIFDPGAGGCDHSGSGFCVAGMDYKSALLLTSDQTRSEFDKRLRLLDKELRKILLELLPKSDKSGARELKRILEKDSNYRFDLYYGLDRRLTSASQASDVLYVAYLLATQALKGAALARYVSKGRALRKRVARKFASGTKSDPRTDTRGKEFKAADFLRAARNAPALKDFVIESGTRGRENTWDYNTIYIDTVWTRAFFKTQRTGNPDVIRDVRKKKLVRPGRPNLKITFEGQKELLELWLVILNLIDVVKSYLSTEFPDRVDAHHQLAVEVFDNVRDLSTVVDTRKLEPFLTRDLRGNTTAVLGTASEFQFFCGAADSADRMFFNFDARDLGVEVMLLYDVSNAKIVDGRLTDRHLLEETNKSTDGVTRMRRATYDLVLRTFENYHRGLAQTRDASHRRLASLAFRKIIPPPRDFAADVQVMLGGDEVFVAAHPYFVTVVHQIIADLAKEALARQGKMGDSRVFEMRCAVAFSKAQAPGVRKSHQYAHYQALRLADLAQSQLKDLERQHRRIERLVMKLDENEKKRAVAPAFYRRLNALRLTKLFVTVHYGNPQVLELRDFRRVLEGLRAGRVHPRDRDRFQLVDFNGRQVNRTGLKRAADRLERDVRNKVGRDNVHVDLPPGKKIK